MADEDVDLTELKKDELIEEAEDRGLATSGLRKDELLEEILAADADGPGGKEFTDPVEAADTEFDPDHPGGMSFDVGRPAEEE